MRTPIARRPAPIYARLMSPFGAVASGDSTERKKAAGTMIAAMGTEPRTIHFRKSERLASSTWRRATSARMSQTRMGMPGPPQILPQRVLHVSGVTDQEAKKAHATEHNGRENDRAGRLAGAIQSHGYLHLVQPIQCIASGPALCRSQSARFERGMYIELYLAQFVRLLVCSSWLMWLVLTALKGRFTLGQSAPFTLGAVPIVTHHDLRPPSRMRGESDGDL